MNQFTETLLIEEMRSTAAAAEEETETEGEAK